MPEIIEVLCETLKENAHATRIHTPKQTEQIANSIKRFGFLVPILIDADHTILAGHGRVYAARKLGLQSVPCLRVDHLTESEQRAFMLADNKIAENAAWDKAKLYAEFTFLQDLNFDLGVTGFSLPEIDLVFDLNTPKQDAPIPEPPETPVTKPGDLWTLGAHRILCGDALQSESYDTLLVQEKANIVFTDPPYNVKIDGHVCGNGQYKHDAFAMASGEMSETEFTAFLSKVMTQLIEHTHDGSIHYICMDWRHVYELTCAGKAYNALKNICVWNKTNGGMGSLYRSKHELVFVYKNGAAPHVNNIELGKNGRYRTNVWDYAGANTFGTNTDLAMHPTVKPVAMIKDALLDCSNRGDIVLDPFGGSGSTLIAAEQCHRQARLIEYEPRYVDVTIKRWQAATGQKAVHTRTEMPFDGLAGDV